MSNEEGVYRVSSDVMELNVCPACAVDARRLGLTVERLETDYRRPVLSAADAAA
jgi:hypothetical protein